MSPKKTSPKKTSPQKGHTNKENQTSWLNGVVEQGESKSDNQQNPHETSEPKGIKDCPQTPGNRLPLADLIGNAEDAFSRAPVGQELTPEDYVIWQHAPPSSNPSTQTPATQSKKRRHSSSPSSSPLAGSKGKRKESFDLQNFQSLLKTPQNDLATDLWNNYVAKTAANVPDLQQPRFANLLSSSPHTPGSARTGQDSSGLRRSISCNAEWPSTKAKRRKVDGESYHKGRAIFSRTRSNITVPKDLKAANFSSLVQEMERSLKKAAPKQSDPSKTVPVIVHNATRQDRSPSPLETKVAKPPTRQANTGNEMKVAAPAPTNRKPLEDSSSDFGDDDLDDEFLGLADTSDPFVEHTQVNNLRPSNTGNEHALPALNAVQHSFNYGNSNIRAEANTDVKAVSNNDTDIIDIDEFDDDFEGLSDNIDELLAGCDQTASTKFSSVVQQEPSISELQPEKPPKFGTELQNEAKQQPIASSDEFDDDDFDIDCLDQPIAQGEDSPDDTYRGRKTIKRYLIVDIAESTYATKRGRIQPEKVLLVQDEATKLEKVVVLRESWYDSPCDKDHYIHLIGEFDMNGHCIVSDAQNMIIIHPDHLISATVVADSISCQRRAVLQDRIKRTSDLGKPQVFGNIFHEVFQEAITLNQWDTASLRALIEDVAVKHVEELYLIHMSINEAVDHVMSRIPGIQRWAELFLRKEPGPQSFVEDRNSSKLKLSVNKLLEVEEHVWSPMYGLKGNVDATVQVACNDGTGDKNLIVPLELKTGHKETNEAHRAQTALYTLLLSDRYDVEVTFGLLYYLETSKIIRIRGIRHELLHMIQERNRVAGYVRERAYLPPMIKKPTFCNNCYTKTICFIYHKLADDGNGETSGLGDDFDKAMEHLNPSHRDFFRKWDDLLTKEETSMRRFKRELWTLLSHEREALGRCFGNIVIEPGTACEDKDGTKINRYRYTFIKKQQSPTFSFTESQITVGEPIVISDENGHFALANGYVVQISPRRVTVAVDRRLHNARTRTGGFDAKMNQSFRGIMEIEGSTSTASPMELDEEMLYRLDKDEFSNGMAIVRSNLVAMMEKDLFQAGQLRKLIIEGKPPAFKSNVPKLPGLEEAGLNVDQKQAINKVMSAQDYALVLGMPGTGKTTTIAHILRALVAQGKSVLLTSYTHTAVDNILLKIRDDNMRILRIGAATKVHPDVHQFAELAATPKKTIEELKAAYEDSQVVATTCLGVGHHIFNTRVFDYCIVDEASQITLPVCLGPIRMAKTFILVGDHYQLPPLVQNKEAQAGGLDVSLFKLLSDAHPSSVVNLEHQYRMCEDIQLLSKTLIYSGRLKCGTPEVAARSLEVPNISGLKQHHLSDFSQASKSRQLCLGTSQGSCWLRDLVDPSTKTYLVNTDTLGTPARDVTNGARIVNATEATLCTQLVEAFISCGISARSIGVITFYRSQLSLLKQNLRHHLPALEMHTADKFQGRDKEIIILSCVRSNQDNYVGDLLSDWRRVNVAFTRARTKLLVLGSKNTLRNGNELLGKYVNLVEQRGWVYDLPKNAVENHIFDDVPLSTFDRFTPSPVKKKSSPNKSPNVVRKAARNPLSPVQQRLSLSGLRKPAKKGMNILSGQKILGNRPVLQDVVNDVVG
ncbi:bifunctional ATP-dependent DNA helicase/ssDNA endodeoxyribonuclease DNA2 [Aspergillus mulundensis]|uniref:DNA replication ATP-dependent helicase/nuclease n=1 Tax=Aspergillus mulundensis TaxID=1810919 RepID=A0A3D8T6G0_9EURO|nr:hypothetical protein DSM5745_01457 [Aspergillus mulundensis]RDW94135.1 hypothetical protein DSM5745_01457 [Aspergillus mulundensis]